MEPHNALDPNFTFAFQPIVDIEAHEVISYEALVRGPGNQPAHQIFEQVPMEKMHLFDERARMEAIRLAMQSGIGCDLNLNLLPRGLYSSPTAVLSSIEAAKRHHLPIARLVIEVTEGEIIADTNHFASLINRGLGLKLAIDDFELDIRG